MQNFSEKWFAIMLAAMLAGFGFAGNVFAELPRRSGRIGCSMLTAS